MHPAVPHRRHRASRDSSSFQVAIATLAKLFLRPHTPLFPSGSFSLPPVHSRIFIYENRSKKMAPILFFRRLTKLTELRGMSPAHLQINVVIEILRKNLIRKKIRKVLAHLTAVCHCSVESFVFPFLSPWLRQMVTSFLSLFLTLLCCCPPMIGENEHEVVLSTHSVRALC